MADVKRTELLKEEEDLLKAQNKGKDVTDRLNEVCRAMDPTFIPERYHLHRTLEYVCLISNIYSRYMMSYERSVQIKQNLKHEDFCQV